MTYRVEDSVSQALRQRRKDRFERLYRHERIEQAVARKSKRKYQTRLDKLLARVAKHGTPGLSDHELFTFNRLAKKTAS